MDMTKQERLEKLLSAYSHHYDIEHDVTVEGTYYPAKATFFLRDENYLISKKHVLSAVENHEHVFFHLCDNLTAEELKKHIELTRSTVLAGVKPHKEHMSTFATLVVLADTIEPEAKKLIKKTRFSKYFRLALHGWMEYHIAAMEISTNSFLSNPTGRGARKILEGNFAPRKK